MVENLEIVILFLLFDIECLEQVFYFCDMIASEVKETPGGSSECLGKNDTPVPSTASSSNPLKQQGTNVYSTNEQVLPQASNFVFGSVPPMLINEHVQPVLQNIQMPGGGIDSISLSDPTGCRGSSGRNSKTKYPLGKYFSPHWSQEAVEKALEVSDFVISHTCTHNVKLLPLLCNNICLIPFCLQRGDVLKARFHVNVHNTLEVSNIYLIIILFLGIFAGGKWIKITYSSLFLVNLIYYHDD